LQVFKKFFKEVEVEKRTPLSRAAENGQIEVVRLLLENGARPDFEDAPGQTPLSRAIDGGHAAIVELLSSCTS